ncbi:Membrane protein insertion efficiency factor like [Actinidia chinensis var. chinensis]|uniref:Membrane protein insertion efficiency factor like n=1 Tax=Actinidia chinensis var. chinensis TaxID=1590841 RepID=A0A2R6P347_ACTCC|nr:Membrane protein insertion efficiency factor like [Actinidia chinensis var. chinensis]
MAREWKEVITGNGGGDGGGRSDVCLVVWVVLFTFTMISILIFSCADGASRDKASAEDSSHVYGSGCAAGCGAACGG